MPRALLSRPPTAAAALIAVCSLAFAAANESGTPAAWHVAAGNPIVTARGADCPFADSAARALAVAWPSGSGDPESGLLRIEGRFLYPLDELGPPAKRALAVSSDGRLRIGGAFSLPRRDCSLDVEEASLPAIAGGDRPDDLQRLLATAESALSQYRQIRAARRGNRDELHAAAAALSDLSARLGDSNPLVAISALRVGEMFGAVGDYAQAKPLLERAWNGFAAAHGEDDLETLAAMDRVIWNLRERHVGPELVALARRARDLAVGRWGQHHPQSMRTRHTLAGMLSTTGELERAIEEDTRNYEARRDRLGADHLDTLRSLNNLAFNYRSTGRLRQAIEHQRGLYEGLQRIQGADHVMTLIAGNNLALMYDDVGDTAAAVSLLDAVYLKLLASVGPDHPETARTLNGIGTVLAQSGRYAESVEVFRRAVEIRRAAQGPDHPVTLNTMSNLAASLAETGRDDEAADLLRQVVEGLTRTRLPDDDIAYAIRRNYVGALKRAGRVGEASAMAQATLAKALERHAPTKNTVLDLRIMAAEVQVLAGETDAGLRALAEALGDARAAFGDEHPTTLGAFDATATALARLGRDAEAGPLLQDAVAAVERARASPLLTPEYRQGLTARWRPHYANLARHHLRANRIDRAFAVSELAKARGLLESIARNRGLASGVLPKAQEQELREYETRLARLEERIGLAGDNVTRRTALEAERNDVVRAERARRAELARQFPKFARLSEPRLVDVKTGVRAIGPDAVFVSYLLMRDEVVAFALDRRGALRVKRFARPQDLEARIEAVRLLLSTPPGQGLARRPWQLADGTVVVATQRPSADARSIDDAGVLTRALGQLLLDPLKADLHGKPRWIISPDGVLALLPFETLAFGRGLAVELAEISYVQSLSVLNEIHQRKATSAALPRDLALLAFGDPDYSGGARADAAQASPLRSPLRGERSFAMLPASKRELELVSSLFPSTGVRLYTGSSASEPALKALNSTRQLGRFRYLLLSAHGVMHDDAPALSAIVLAQDNVNETDDGYITAAEWPQYDLHTDLVLLSACETATGKLVTGEGVLGLPYALFAAGNAESLLTLWKIEDRGAAEFSGRLFRHLRAGVAPARAAALAKRELMRDARFGKAFFWAPYVLYGG